MALESPRISAPASYIMAVIVGVAAALLRWSMTGALGTDGLYLTVFPAVMLCGVFLGVGPGILAAIVGVACIEYTFFDPSVTMLAVFLRSMLVIISAGTVAYLGSAMKARLPGTGYLALAPVRPAAPVATSTEADASIRAAIALGDTAKLAKERFLGQVSQQLRAPLAQSLALTSKLQQDAALSPDSREMLANLRAQLERQTRLVNDLWDMTRLASARLEIYRRPLMLHDVIKTEARLCSEELKRRGMKLVLRLEAQDSLVSGDPARLGQVVSNLLSNAQRFGAERGTICVSTSNVGKRIILIVEDDGVGIEPAVLAQMFDAFEQGESSPGGGLGLGLAMCKGLVALHGGSIKAQNQSDGKGARFEIELPLLPALPEDPGLFPAPEL